MHALRNDSLNEMGNAACANDQGIPRSSSNSLLTATDPILQNTISQQVMQQNENPSNNNNQLNNDSTRNPDSSV